MKIRFIISCLAILFTLNQSFAQDYVRIQNRWKTDEYLFNSNGIECGPVEPGWWSADWIFEPAGDYYRIRNRWKTDEYLFNSNGKIEAGPVERGWWSADWTLIPVGDYYQIQNRWKPHEYLNNQNGKIESGAIESGWWSAQWKLVGFETINTNVSSVAWITKNYQKLKNIALNRLVLPGSHDSGTHKLQSTYFRGVEDAFAPDTNHKKRGLSFLGEGYKKWAKAQERSIYQQLEDGIRYIDIRVCIDKSGNAKTCHGLYGASVKEVIDDVKAFSDKYPDEPILLDFNHFYDWEEKTGNGKENDAGYQGIRQSKLNEVVNLVKNSLGDRLALNDLNPDSKLSELMESKRPIIVLWDRDLDGEFQRKHFWRTSEITNSYSDDIQELRTDKITYLETQIRNNQNSSEFFLLTGQITPSDDLYGRSFDPTSGYPLGLENLAKQTNPVVLSYVANEWKNYKHNIISIDFYNQSGLVELCKKLNGLPANPTGVSYADREASNWGNWRSSIADIFVTQKSEWKVTIDACHSDLDDTDTDNRITVSFWVGNQYIGGKYVDGISTCKVWDTEPSFVVNTNLNVTHITIETNGGDGLFIDELRMYKGDELKKHEGRDDGNGWCLSTQANDADGDWSGKVAGGTCKSKFQFNY